MKDNHKEIRKDAQLVSIADSGFNTPQFISIDSNDIANPYIRLVNREGIYEGLSLGRQIDIFIDTARNKTVQVYGFKTGKEFTNESQGHMSTSEEVLEVVRENAEKGYHSLITQTINIEQFGVKGVVEGDVIEFDFNTKDNFVDEGGEITSLPKEIGLSMITSIYGNLHEEPDVVLIEEVNKLSKLSDTKRVEFTVHRNKVGVKAQRLVITGVQEINTKVDHHYPGLIQRPTNFSKRIGDKLFGILIAQAMGYNIPAYTVYVKKIPNANIYHEGGCDCDGDIWTRVATDTRQPSKYPSVKGCITKEVHDDICETGEIASVIVMNDIKPTSTGTIELTQTDVEVNILQGATSEETENRKIVNTVIDSLKPIYSQFKHNLGDILISWGLGKDGKVYVFQLTSLSQVKYPKIAIKNEQQTDKDGYPILTSYRIIDLTGEHTIEDLKRYAKEITGDKTKGIHLVADVGLTSYPLDILRHYQIPTKLDRP